jgi:mitochondrial fission protein ELM1
MALAAVGRGPAPGPERMQALGERARDMRRDGPLQPRVWLVLGDKRGDNAQVEVIERALGWDCERKNVVMREPFVLGKPRVKPSLHHIDPARSDPLEPPWPDLIITIGRRPSMVALWIAEQSGGRTRLVLVGKPSGMMGRFDLVITGAETQMPALPNVLPIALPLMRVDEAGIEGAAASWRPRFAALPRPLIAFLIGGPTGPFVFDDAVLERLLAMAEEVVDRGGTPYVTTSRRTPATVTEALGARLPASAQLFRWSPDAGENPYRGLLGLADGFVVTGESISMIVEIARLGRPLAIFDLPCGWLGAIDQQRRSLTRRLFTLASDPARRPLLRRLANAAHHARFLNHARDFRAFHQMLIDRGLATWAGQGFCEPRVEVPDDLPLVVARIKALLAPPG